MTDTTRARRVRTVLLLDTGRGSRVRRIADPTHAVGMTADLDGVGAVDLTITTDGSVRLEVGGRTVYTGSVAAEAAGSPCCSAEVTATLICQGCGDTLGDPVPAAALPAEAARLADAAVAISHARLGRPSPRGYRPA